jgi:hypothetical protein
MSFLPVEQGKLLWRYDEIIAAVVQFAVHLNSMIGEEKCSPAASACDLAVLASYGAG